MKAIVLFAAGCTVIPGVLSAQPVPASSVRRAYTVERTTAGRSRLGILTRSISAAVARG